MRKSTKLLFTATTLAAAAIAASVARSTDHAAMSGMSQPMTGADHSPKVDSTKPLWHCGMHPQVIQDHPGFCPICHMALTPLNHADHAGEMSADGSLMVFIDPTIVQNMGVRTAKVVRGPLMRSIRAVGVLRLPEPGMHDVSLKVAGWVDKLYADQDGMHVVQGEPLFDLYSPELQLAEQELITAVKAAKSMPADGNEGERLIDSSKRKLRLWDIADKDIDAIANSDTPPKTVPIRSPATGHLEEKTIVQGSAIPAMTRIFRIADHSKMWLEAQVYQDQLDAIHPSQEVRATLDGMPAKTWTGKISFLYPHLDHMSRTLTVRMTLDNPDFILKPGMYATAQIMTEPAPDALQVPREAVIDTGNRQIVFIDQGEGHFAPRNVHMGVTGDDGNVQILDGLTAGESVVTSGQFLIDVESRTVEAIAKLNPTTMPTTAPASQPASQPVLAIAYCPMAKASWLQHGQEITNPYMGTAMATCGSIKKTINNPADPALKDLLAAYMDFEKGLDADRVDSASMKAMASQSAKLTDKRYVDLRDSIGKLGDAKDIEATRKTFHLVSDRLIESIDPGAAR
jgi:Cu(I)/Ag(I) efflux system membrane fusion protein